MNVLPYWNPLFYFVTVWCSTLLHGYSIRFLDDFLISFLDIEVINLSIMSDVELSGAAYGSDVELSGVVNSGRSTRRKRRWDQQGRLLNCDRVIYVVTNSKSHLTKTYVPPRLRAGSKARYDGQSEVIYENLSRLDERGGHGSSPRLHFYCTGMASGVSTRCLASRRSAALERRRIIYVNPGLGDAAVLSLRLYSAHMCSPHRVTPSRMLGRPSRWYRGSGLLPTAFLGQPHNNPGRMATPAAWQPSGMATLVAPPPDGPTWMRTQDLVVRGHSTHARMHALSHANTCSHSAARTQKYAWVCPDG